MANLSINNDQFSKNNVMVCAPTGVAAKNIGGTTCHNAFKLPIEKFSVGSYEPLKGITKLIQLKAIRFISVY